MRLHKNTYKIILGISGLILLDLITHKLWLILLYLSAWGLLLLRRSNNNLDINGITSPVNGTVTNISRSRLNDGEITIISINTMPIRDPQDFIIINHEKLIGISAEGDTKILEYDSGIKVTHIPTFGLSSFFANLKDSNSRQEQEESVYGYSLLGSKTIIHLPKEYSTCLFVGQRVISGQTIIGGSAC